MKTDQEHILQKPIYSLGMSREFCGITEILGFHTLAELLQHHTSDLLKLPGFSLHLLYEYINFLEHNDLGHYIDPVA